MAMAFTVVILAGVFQILFGFFRLGRYVTQMPYTVISGFMSGIGAILVILQLPAFLGQKAVGGVMGTLTNLPGLITGVQPMELTLALITMAILWLTPSSVKRFCPPQLLALVVGHGEHHHDEQQQRGRVEHDEQSADGERVAPVRALPRHQCA